MNTNDNPAKAFDKATEAALEAAEAVLSTRNSVKEAIGASQRPGGLLDQASRFAREAPLRSLAIAFLAGMLASRLR
jgi:hypothetical protein